MKSFFSDEPTVHLAVVENTNAGMMWNGIQTGNASLSENWNRTEGSNANIITFTNGDEVELLLNGKSLGRQKSDKSDPFKRGLIKWNKVDYGKGGNLVAIAYNDGKEVARHRIQTAGKAVKLIVESEDLISGDWKGDNIPGMNLQYLTIRAVDKQRNTVPSFDEPLTITVEGTGATLLSLDNGDHYTSDLFGPSVNTKKMYMGQMQVILRSTRQGGKYTVKVASPSLKARWKSE
jgi:beta-galactosidase